MLDMMKMMGKIKEAQEKMKKIKDELDTIELKSESGAGLVSVHINGKKEILSINIDKSILDEKEMLQDLVVAATNKALNDRIPQDEIIEFNDMMKNLSIKIKNSRNKKRTKLVK